MVNKIKFISINISVGMIEQRLRKVKLSSRKHIYE